MESGGKRIGWAEMRREQYLNGLIMPNGLGCLILVAAILLGGCLPRVQDIGPPVGAPRLSDDALITADGARLPLRAWPAAGAAAGPVLIALHGFNDYSNAFADAGAALAARGFTVYAYDQRGFGAAPYPGVWAGTQTLIGDLGQMVAAVRSRHPNRPIYLLGDSMGGAVVMALMADAGADIAGAVLIAPAVWGRATMNLFYRVVLWTAAHSLPWVTVTGRGLDITPSDNREMLIALSRDPLVIKETRIDAIYGIVNLMDRALAGASEIRIPLLVLYGARDEIIPKEPTLLMIDRLTPGRRIAVYPNGYHMLLRDLQAEVVIDDLAAWLADRQAGLPSGQDQGWRARLTEPGVSRAGP